MSKQPKLTEWIDPEVKPTLVGLYQRMYDGFERSTLLQRPDWWDGEVWRYGTSKDTICMIQNRPWRGLAEDPNKGK